LTRACWVLLGVFVPDGSLAARDAAHELLEQALGVLQVAELALADAHGFVTSNFLLSDTGDLTDHHLGLLFVERPD